MSDRTTVDFQTACDLNDMLEDAVSFICEESFRAGRPVSGETVWQLVEAYAATKGAQFEGLVA